MNKNDIDSVMATINAYGETKYKEGLGRGLQVAEMIVGWLTMQPDTKRQKQQREWAEKEIAKMRKRYGIGGKNE